jgi:hypothetical protein
MIVLGENNQLGVYTWKPLRQMRTILPSLCLVPAILDPSGTGGHQSHMRTLPGLRDILTNDPSISPQSPPMAFVHGSTPLYGRPGTDATYRRSTELAPSLTLYDHQLSSPGGTYTSQSGRTSNVPSLKTKRFTVCSAKDSIYKLRQSSDCDTPSLSPCRLNSGRWKS